MFFLTRLLSVAPRLPLILCGAPSLGHDTARALPRWLEARHRRHPSKAQREFNECIFALHTSADRPFKSCVNSEEVHVVVHGSSSPRKELMKRGFRAMVCWSMAHRLAAGADCTSAHNLVSKQLDVAAVEWSQKVVNNLSCGQGLVCITFLCDALCSILRERPRSPGPEEDSQPANTHLALSLCSTIVTVVRRVASSTQLSSQPLPRILSALYGLYRVTHPSCDAARGQLDASAQALLQPPLPLLAAMLQAVRSQCSVEPAESDGTSLPGDAIELLLTFLLIIDKSTQRELLTEGDRSVFSLVFRQLLRLIKPHLIGKAEVLRQQHARQHDKSGNSPLYAVASDASSTGEQPRRQLSIDECACILRNVDFARPHVRLALLEYLLCVLLKPSSMTAGELQRLPGVFGTLSNMSVSHYQWLTDFIVRAAPVTSLPLAARLLAYVHDPVEYIARFNVTDEAITSLSSVEAAQLLHAAGLRFSWTTQKKLISKSLEGHPAVAAAVLGRSTINSKGDDLPASSEAHQPLDAETYLSLCFLLDQKLQERDTMNAEEYTEAHALAHAISSCVDWSAGVDALAGQRAELHVCLKSPQDVVGVADPVHARLTFNALLLYVACVLKYQFEKVVKMDDLALLNQYVRHLLLPGVLSPFALMHSLVGPLLDLLEAPENKAKLVARVARSCGAQSPTSLLEFIGYLAPAATRLRVYDADIVKALLKLRSVAPKGAKESPNPADHVGLSPLLELHARNIVNALDYLLYTEEKQLPDANSAVRHVGNTWFEQFALALTKPIEAGRVGGAEAAATDDQSKETAGTAVVDAEAEECSANKNVLTSSSDPSAEADKKEGSTEAHRTFLSEQIVEALLTVLIRAGCRVPHHFYSYLARSVKEKMASGSREVPQQMAEQSALTHCMKGAAKDCEGHAIASERQLDSCASAAAMTLSLDALPLPAHFIMCVRGDLAVSVPLSAAYLHHLLSMCDLRIYSIVVVSFEVWVSKLFPQLNLRVDLEICTAAFEVLCRRISNFRKTDFPAELSPTGVSSAAIRTMQVVLGRLSRLPQRIEKFKELNRAPAAAAATYDQSEPPVSTLSVSSGVQWGDQALVQQRHAADQAALHVLSFLQPAHLKELALANLDRMELFFPSAARHAASQISQQIASLTSMELLKLVSVYPAATEVVLAQLKRTDILISVDFAAFLRAGKTIPMAVCRAIIQVHLPRLNFAQTTRLLSMLVDRHESLPYHDLAQILSHAETLVDGATASDRNILLVVLQGYSNFDHRARSNDSLFCSSGLAVEGVREGGRDGASPLPPAVTPEKSSSLTADEVEARLKLVQNCCRTVLQLERVHTVGGLRDFLATYFTTLHGGTKNTVVEHAETRVLGDLLRADTPDVASLLAFVQLLRSRDLLRSSATTAIYNAVFSETGEWVRQNESSGPGEAACASWPSADLASIVSLAVSLSGGMACGADELTSESGGATTQASKTPDEAFMVGSAIERIKRRFSLPSERLFIFSALVDALVTRSSSAASFVRPGERAPLSVPAEMPNLLCIDLLQRSRELSASAFAKLMQNVSRLKKWSLVRELVLSEQNGVSRDARGGDCFDAVFRSMFANADAHSRCVIVRAVASDAVLFAIYQSFMVGLIQRDVELLSHEDIELLLAATVNMQATDAVESLLDTVGTRLLGMLDQCNLRTIVRLLHCHAKFDVQDDALTTRALNALSAQCSREARLEPPQILTLLQSTVRLDILVPEKLLMQCFARLEKFVEHLSQTQLAQAGQLICDLEMGYTASVHTLVMRILENREGYRGSSQFRAVVELLCDTYDVEAPTHLRVIRLRKRRAQDRMNNYWQRRGELLFA